MRIRQRQRTRAEALLDGRFLRAVLDDPLGPELETPFRHLQRHLHRQAVAETPGRMLAPREEGEIGAGMSRGIGKEQVIRAGLVLIHALLDETHAEHAGVVIEILLRGTGDGGDVMKAGCRSHGIS